MGLRRYELTDEEWELIAHHLRDSLTLSEAQQVRAIRHLVASAVTGLKPQRVSIVDEAGSKRPPWRRIGVEFDDERNAGRARIRDKTEPTQQTRSPAEKPGTHVAAQRARVLGRASTPRCRDLPHVRFPQTVPVGKSIGSNRNRGGGGSSKNTTLPWHRDLQQARCMRT